MLEALPEKIQAGFKPLLDTEETHVLFLQGKCANHWAVEKHKATFLIFSSVL